jgi:hypothetical protein
VGSKALEEHLECVPLDIERARTEIMNQPATNDTILAARNMADFKECARLLVLGFHSHCGVGMASGSWCEFSIVRGGTIQPGAVAPPAPKQDDGVPKQSGRCDQVGNLKCRTKAESTIKCRGQGNPGSCWQPVRIPGKAVGEGWWHAPPMSGKCLTRSRGE